MKKCLLLLSLLLLVWNARATHLMGGDITVYPDSANPATYHFKVVHYRDTAGIPAAQSIQVFLHTWDANTNNWSNVYTQFMLNLDPAQSGQNLANFPYGVQVYTYVSYQWSGMPLTPGRYRIDATECCRNAAILNMANPLGESMTLSAEFVVPPTGSNTTPEFLAMPIVYLPVNQPWYYNPLPYDADGDSISWAMTIPNSEVLAPFYVTINPVAGYTPPAATAAGAFTLNPLTGEVTWTPSTVGHFVASFTITEYKNGIAAGHINRDMQYVVINSNTPAPSFVSVTPVHTNTAGSYNYISYQPGQPLQFKIRGTDGSSNTLKMECFSGLFQKPAPPTFSYAQAGSGNTVEGTFTWTPPAGHMKNEIVVFRVGNGVFSKDYTLVLRHAATTGVGTAANPVEQLTAYPNPAAHHLNVSMKTASAADLSLRLVDAAGRIVQQLFTGQVPQGQWQMGFDLNPANGVYFLQALSGGAVTSTRKITIIQ